MPPIGAIWRNNADTEFLAFDPRVDHRREHGGDDIAFTNRFLRFDRVVFPQPDQRPAHILRPSLKAVKARELREHICPIGRDHKRPQNR